MRGKKVGQVRTQVKIRTSADKVWGALLDLGLIKQWWGASEGVIEPRKGGAWALAWGGAGQGYRYVVSGVIRSLVTARRLRIEPLVYFNAEHPAPGPMRMSISLAEKDGLTRVIVRQEPIAEAPEWDRYSQRASEGWREALGNLKRLLEGG